MSSPETRREQAGNTVVLQTSRHPLATRVALGVSSLILVGILGSVLEPAAPVVANVDNDGKGVSTVIVVQSPTPDIPATVRAALATPTVAPVGTATPNALATRIADTQQTLRELRDLQVALDALRSTPPPAPAPAPQPQQPPPGVVIVHPDVVKPEVVKPEVVKVPEIMTVQVPVRATPDPDVVSLHQKDFDELVERRAEEVAKVKLTQAAKLTPTLAATPAPKVVVTEVEKGGVSGWWIPVAAIGGIILGLASATREIVVERIHPHTH